MNVTSSHKRPDISEFNLTAAAEIMQQYRFEKSIEVVCTAAFSAAQRFVLLQSKYVQGKAPVCSIIFAIAEKENYSYARNGL